MFRSLRRKILASYLLLVMFLVAVGAWSVFNFSRLSGKMQEVTRENYRSTLAAQNMVAALERQDSAMLMALAGDQSQALSIFHTGQADFLIWFGRAEDNITLREETQIVDSIHREYQEYTGLWERMRGAPLSEAKALYTDQAYTQFLLVRGLCQELLRVNHEALDRGNAGAVTNARWATWSTIGVTGAAALLALLLAVGLAETIVRPVERLNDFVRRTGAGAPRETLPVLSSDEIGQLTGEFNRMTARLRQYEETNLGQLMAERRKSEVILKTITDPVLMLDPEMKVVLINPAGEQALGLREAAALGKDFLAVTGNADLFNHLKSAQQPGPLVAAYEQPTVALTVKGQERFFSVAAVPLNDSHGTPIGLVAVLNDVTWFKQADRVKSEFVSMVSHEFRTPLTTIAMGVGLLRESPTIPAGSRNAELLDAVAEETGRLTRLVNDLLDLSRMESGRIEMTLAPLRAEQLLERVAAVFEPQTAEKAIALKTAGEAVTVSADGDKITWVLTNLISNALRYTPTGGSITLSAERRGEVAVLSVSDTGVGIPPEMQQRIFEKFYQIPGRPGGGAGLGLAISREIVRAHGGHMWVESPPGQGARFYFTLPIALAPAGVQHNQGGRTV